MGKSMRKVINNHLVASFSPTIPATMSAADAIRNAEADSPNMTMPAMNPPTAPTPVHTAYAVPIGIDFMATASSQTLAAIPPTNTASAATFLKPSLMMA